MKKSTYTKKANKRGVARLLAVQAAYQMELTGNDVWEVVKEFEIHNFPPNDIDGIGYLEADPQWFRKVILGIVSDQKYLDPLIRSYLSDDWPLSRVDSLLRSILRAGVWEIKNCLDVPLVVAINEYVDIAKAFFEDGDEVQLVNGVLHNIGHDIRG